MTQRFLSAAKYVMQQINPSNLSGAIDVVVVAQPDGSLLCSPFHVRFGKLGTLVAEGRPVDVFINGHLVPELRMKLGSAGEAFFVAERHLEAGQTPPDDGTAIITSPITSDAEEEEEAQPHCLRRTQSFSESDRGDVTFYTDLEAAPSPSHGGSNKKRRRTRRSKANGDVEEVPGLPTGPGPAPIRCFSDDELPSTAAGAAVDEETATPLADTSRFLSDTALDQAGAADADQGLTWQWGELPVEERMGGLRRKRRQARRNTVAVAAQERTTDSDEAGDEADEEGAESEVSSGGAPEVASDLAGPLTESTEEMVAVEEGPEPEKRPETMAATPLDPGDGQSEVAELESGPAPVYLSEVIERPELQDLYVYRRPPDGAARDGAASPVDQGYRSDGEGSAAPASPSGGCSPSPSRVEDDDSARLHPVHLSLCGMDPGDSSGSNPSAGPDGERFHAHMVLYEEFCRDPEAVLANPDLVVQINNKYYSWPVASTLLVASLVYQCELPPKVVDRMLQKHEERRESKRRGSMFARWTGWGRSRPPQPPTVNPPSTVHDDCKEGTETSEQAKTAGDGSEDKSASRLLQINSTSTSNSNSTRGADAVNDPSADSAPGSRLIHVKTLRLSSDQLHRLKLRPGANQIEYRVTSQFQGTTRCQAYIFLWEWTDKLVVSDIDGTITQSDVMGQLGPFLGRDVSQRGIAGLYSGIARNRYRLLYLSSRAIGQAHWTRSYLQSVVQENGVRLPNGPVLLSPTSLFYALVREIRNRPEDFKIPCLKDVRSLFPQEVQPFFAGFGNKVNDVRSYQAVGIDSGRIFVVDRMGALRKQSHVSYRTSYASLGELVHHFFPEVDGEEERGEAASDGVTQSPRQFSHFSYWRAPVLEVSEDGGLAGE